MREGIKDIVDQAMPLSEALDKGLWVQINKMCQTVALELDKAIKAKVRKKFKRTYMKAKGMDIYLAYEGQNSSDIDAEFTVYLTIVSAMPAKYNLVVTGKDAMTTGFQGKDWVNKQGEMFDKFNPKEIAEWIAKWLGF